MDPVEILGMLAAALVVISFIPQVHKTWKTKHAKDFSWAWLSLLFTGQMLWLAYGLIIGNVPIILTNLLTSSLLSVIIFHKYKYG